MQHHLAASGARLEPRNLAVVDADLFGVDEGLELLDAVVVAVGVDGDLVG